MERGGGSRNTTTRLLVMGMKRVRMIMIMIMMLLIMSMSMSMNMQVVEGLWCVARSDASENALQKGLDYACAAGADCAPILEQGLCYLPNTMQAHASYAFNSYYQRSNMAPGSCDFSGTATLAKTDPSYGSCVYPASPSTAGAASSTTGGTPRSGPYGNVSPLTPTITSPPTVDGGIGLNPNNMGPPIPTTSDSKASLRFSAGYSRLLEMSLFLFLQLAII